MPYTRYAIYHLPPDGDLADFGASWLGWDAKRGCAVEQPDVPGLRDVTLAPSKYGFHATLKPPFRLREGTSLDDLSSEVAALAARLSAAKCGQLELIAMGRFLALVPTGDTSAIAQVAAACVTELDDFREPLTEAELARRRKGRLTPEQDALLVRWGYPYVFDHFRFHITLTSPLPKAERDRWSETLEQHLPPLDAEFALESIALVGEREDGIFECIQSFALSS